MSKSINYNWEIQGDLAINYLGLYGAIYGNMLDEEKIPEENPIKINSALIFSKDDKIKNVSLEDFKVLKILGRGAFGKVYLVKFNKTNQLYAMKSIKKIYLNDQNEINNV